MNKLVRYRLIISLRTRATVVLSVALLSGDRVFPCDPELPAGFPAISRPQITIRTTTAEQQTLAMLVFLALAVSCALFKAAAASDNCYDHQTVTYDARFKPTYCIKTCTVTPFFSPDTSVDTYVKLIESAKETIDIYTPGKPTRSIYLHVDIYVYSICQAFFYSSSCQIVLWPPHK